MNIAELMKLFSDPEIIKGLSFSDKMMGVMVSLILGMGITFLALVFLMFLIGCMAKLLAEKPKETTEQLDSESPKSTMKSESIEPELVAAITAAVAAKMGIPEQSIIKTAIKIKAA